LAKESGVGIMLTSCEFIMKKSLIYKNEFKSCKTKVACTQSQTICQPQRLEEELATWDLVL
jgi:hypothetical protein